MLAVSHLQPAPEPAAPCTIVVTIDNLETIRDAYGDLLAESLVDAIVRPARNVLRRDDVITRVDSASFAIALADSEATAALPIAARIRAALPRTVELHGLLTEVDASVELVRG
jgi:GGDEF domain-containing protein